MGRPESRWHQKPDGSAFLSLLTLDRDAVQRLNGTRSLTLCNVRLGPGVTLAELQLTWLDLRGGTRSNVDDVGECVTLRGLCINQVRGLTDVDPVSRLSGLEILSLYGLAKLTHLPDLSRLAKLRRLDVGKMRSLTDWRNLASPPALEELQFQNKLAPSAEVMAAVGSSAHLARFGWYAPDEPRSIVDPIIELVAKAPARWVRPEEWLESLTTRETDAGSREVPTGSE